MGEKKNGCLGGETVMHWWRLLLCRFSDCVFTFFHDVEVIETYDAATRKLRCVHPA